MSNHIEIINYLLEEVLVECYIDILNRDYSHRPIQASIHYE